MKRPWFWERLKEGGDRYDRGWDGWMASLTQWTGIWLNFRVGNGQGGVACCSPWGHRVGQDWATELNWTNATTFSKASPLTINSFDFIKIIKLKFGAECVFIYNYLKC